VSERAAAELEIRRATDDDLPQVLELLQSSLGWVPDEQYAAFYRWKHYENPFGRSPAWVAVDAERIVGLRVWLRWRFIRSGEPWEAVRAVDTATHPGYQGRGIFRLLTTSSLDVLREEGVAHVFNTPNDRSRPGYLKMGWQEVGRLPVAVRFRSPLAGLRAVRARVPADKWSIPTGAGVAAVEALADGAAVTELLRSLPDDRIRTDLSVEVLRWRYGYGPLRYRAITADHGILLFRLRCRGPAVECVVGHVLACDAHTRRGLLRQVASDSRADHVLLLTSKPYRRAGFMALPGGGPLMTWRAVTERHMPTLAEWDLSMGDVELM
jgi:GNAT superfamily N-acetyltransferase